MDAIRYCRVNDRILDLEKLHEEVMNLNLLFLRVYSPWVFKDWITEFFPNWLLRHFYIIVIFRFQHHLFTQFFLFASRAQNLFFVMHTTDNRLTFSTNFLKRIQVIRRSYRQQLADAISQVSSEHKVGGWICQYSAVSFELIKANKFSKYCSVLFCSVC